MAIKRGEIYWVEFDPVKGSEQGGIRPALVVQNDVGNEFSPTAIVAAITRTMPPRSFPFVVKITPKESGLPFPSAVNCSQIATIQQKGADSRLRPPSGKKKRQPIGQLNQRKMAEVDKAIKFNLGL